jgi:hypothetical protein
MHDAGLNLGLTENGRNAKPRSSSITAIRIYCTPRWLNSFMTARQNLAPSVCWIVYTQYDVLGSGANRPTDCLLYRLNNSLFLASLKKWATGRIEMYKGKPEIRINAASQLEYLRILKSYRNHVWPIPKNNQRRRAKRIYRIPIPSQPD